MDKNLTKALEALAKYGLSVYGFAENIAEGNVRAEITLLSIAKTHLSISTDIPYSEKIEIADNLYSAAKEYKNYFQLLVDACDEIQNECAEIRAKTSEEKWEKECEEWKKHHDADSIEYILGEFAKLNMR